MIVKDEEASLPRCLDSVKRVVDEIIIADTGSKDKSASIAKAAGAKVIQVAWNNDFSAARNAAIQAAKGDWILVLDADEYIHPDDQKNLLECTQKKGVDGYLVPINNYTNDEAIVGFASTDNLEAKGFFRTEIIRLFRKGIRFTGAVHELLAITEGMVILKAPIIIHHTGYLKGQDMIEQKRELYLKLGIKQIEEQPGNPKPFFDVGKIHLHRREYGLAKEFLEKAAMRDPANLKVLCTLAEVEYLSGDPAKAKKIYQQVIQKNPESDTALTNLGVMYFQDKEFEKAIQHLRKPAEKGIPAALMNLALICVKQKEYGKAFLYYRKGSFQEKVEKLRDILKNKYNDAKSLQTIAHQCVKNKQFADAVFFLELAIEQEPNEKIEVLLKKYKEQIS